MMQIYEKVRTVPNEAKKTIKGGRLSGYTDINPMWRIKTLTEVFGVAGFGWYYEITDKRLETGANGEVAAFVDINLYVKVDNEWSKPIQGTGGSSFIAKEKNGLYTSDECFKMALTDAISVACKALGFGADVYWDADRSKYDKPDNDTVSKLKAEILDRLGGNVDVANATARKYWKKYFNQLTEAELNNFLDRMNKEE